MRWPWQQREPMTPQQLDIEGLLAQLADLPVGWSVTLPDRANDGLGGLTAKRYSKYTLVFQRTGFLGRSRWADGPDEARRELQAYLDTGKLLDPDNVKGW